MMEMGSRSQVFLLIFASQILAILGQTNSNDVTALFAIKSSWNNLPPNWEGSDPCGSSWEGIVCKDSRITSIKLSGMGLEGNQFGDLSSLTALQILDLSNNVGLKGTLPSSIGNLKNLTTLILVGCSFFGPIPESIGSLQQLVFISLTSNSFTGPIPPSIGNLSKLSWLDLSDNKLSGTIPVSKGSTPGLDWLVNTRHLHLSKNQLSGPIQSQLFSPNMKLIHVILDHNQLIGEIPESLGSLQNLEILRLDWNSLSGSVPSNLTNITSLNELYLSSNNLNGSIPDLTGMNLLTYVGMSNNSFNASGVPQWLTSLSLLKTIYMEDTTLQEQIPVDLFNLPNLETIGFANNNLSGTLDIGTRYGNNLTLDLRNNSIKDFTQKTGYNMNISLSGNPICDGTGATAKYCTVQISNDSFSSSLSCPAMSCSSDKTLSPTCKCSYPFSGTLHFFSLSFSNLENSSYFTTLAGSMMSAFLSNGLPVDSVSLSDPTVDVYSYLQIEAQIFPSTQNSFNRTSISSIGFLLNRNPFQLQYFGPFFFTSESYCCFADKMKKSSHTGIIVGASVGGAVLVLLTLCAGLYAFHQRKIAKRAGHSSNPFETWDRDKSGAVPQLKGARWFSFEEIRKCTNNFSESNCIGTGGYGKVYKGTLTAGEVVAIKRAQHGSMQGAFEFKTEIELLSRIHHKNVVKLVGFCYEQGEQMLVYEYISKGTLRESLSVKPKIQLDWTRRLRIALDAARGLAYLHELADPPIIHRDVKSNNILLDDHLTAKVADFGLSLLKDDDKGHVTTQVKGTLGYLDPEYYMSQQLTEKSDVYSFGVVLLEVITARAPIERGKHIVRLVAETRYDSKDNSKLYQLIDPRIGPGSKLEGVDRLFTLGMRCVNESGAERPSMGEVVKEIENIIELTSLTKYTDEDLTSTSFEDTTQVSLDDFYNDKAFDYSGKFPSVGVRNATGSY
ncbi:leucine-rich repeat receptor protein kinase HPCA1-like [Nicotiana tomentosiformis]|uniref:non-specific serine/threonine protein kinase n=1 Tax=Nicotiana tabacum TaxID=4097 RepID=A0A1S4CWS2_TOBAC|nr:probable leucine-rich repeat receptor-like protein kinase At5g49770 [Nicotiana tomentosiformis]XP_016505600.1 PREDICTED: probable leucine-rich repeat receptor-like protein kinase At5g49770 [Nicotiana tabacum]XP_018624258.1 probable leucine-rich repeat receptor-like protein kinase At5g49770 [Nicotiana tomentosiformis]